MTDDLQRRQYQNNNSAEATLRRFSNEATKHSKPDAQLPKIGPHNQKQTCRETNQKVKISLKWTWGKFDQQDRQQLDAPTT